MKILIVSAQLPHPGKGGAYVRNYYLLKALASQHTVSLLSVVDGAELEVDSDTTLLEDVACPVQVIPRLASRPKRLQQLMSLVRGKSYSLNMYMLSEMQDALDAILTRDHYDVVLFESVLLAGYRIPPGVKHWHGATATTRMIHVALHEHLNGKSSTGWRKSATNSTAAMSNGD